MQEIEKTIHDILYRNIEPLIFKADIKKNQHLKDLIEKQFIIVALKKTKFVNTRASRILNMNRNTLRKRIAALGIDVESIKNETN
jgi:DNA-binding NtrC family response regulator